MLWTWNLFEDFVWRKRREEMDWYVNGIPNPKLDADDMGTFEVASSIFHICMYVPGGIMILMSSSFGFTCGHADSLEATSGFTLLSSEQAENVE